MAIGPEHARRLMARRLAGEPLQYLEGTAPFTDFEVTVDERVLIPRPETEELWELAAKTVARPGVVVDLGTGSGALALAAARAFPDAAVYATDLSQEALAVAAGNGLRLGLEVTFLHGDLFDPLPAPLVGEVDLVVANPPYVATGEWDNLPADVRREPREALVAGPAGTEVLDRIASDAGRWLRPGGVAVCEIGETQAGHVSSQFASWGDVEVHQDLAGRDRFVLVRRR